jgi:hypothetical protein
MSRWIGTAALALVLTAGGGCVSWPSFPTFTSDPNAERDKVLAAVPTIGDVTEVGNAGPLRVDGVGLVTGLDGTGGTKRDEFRAMLEKELRQRKVQNVSKILDSPDNALVLITALIPPGARKSEPIDIQVSLPQGSPCISLRGGYLQPAVLRNYELTKDLVPDYDGGNRLLTGHILAVAKGPLVVGFGNPGDVQALKLGHVWEGGLSLVERPYHFELKKDDRSAKAASVIAGRINLKFPDDPRKQEAAYRNRHLLLLDEVTQQVNGTFEKTPSPGDRGELAKPLTPGVINVRVPHNYRYNPMRYLLVARNIPLSEEPEVQARYRKRLKEMLVDPQQTLRAAIRLEALGKESLPVLKQALDSDNTFVRYAAGETLVYLGEPVGVEAVAQAAKNDPNLRAYALIALASLDEGICRTKLQELLHTDDVELRAGAFQALRLAYSEMARNDRELETAMARLGGEALGSFWLYRVAPNGQKAVNFATSKRPEIILFGDNVALTTAARLCIRAGEEFVVTADVGDERCFVSRIGVGRQQRKQCSLKLEDILRSIVDLGGQYTDAVDLLRNLDEQRCLNCAVQRLTPPQALPLEELMAQSAPAPTTRSQGGE